MLKGFKFLLFISTLFLFSCLEKEYSSTDDDSESSVRTTQEPETEAVSVSTESQVEAAVASSASRKRIKDKLVLRSNTNSRYSSSRTGTLSFTGGKQCDDYDKCIAICNRMMKTSRTRCYGYSYAVVEDMEKALFTIRNIEEANRVDIDPYIFEAILTANKKIVSKLVEDEMGEGDLKSFLAWVALNDDIAEVLKSKDRSGDILEEAFEQLGKLQEGATKNYRYIGLNVGLITKDDTFLYLSADEENQAAFVMAYDILSSKTCRGIVCQKQILCARENRSRSRSSYRYFGNTRGTSVCRTSSEGNRNYARSKSCYVHGSSVWSYLYELIEDKEIRGASSELRTKPLGITECNKICGGRISRTSNETCDLVSPKALR